MIYALFLCLLSHIPYDPVYRESMDLVEVNHYYDEHGRLVFDQVIFYDWQNDVTVYIQVNQEIQSEVVQSVVNRFQVRAWRLIKTPGMLPTRDWSDKMYYLLWIDGEQPRYLKFKYIRETWTQHDPELVEREFLPKEKRKELRSRPLPKKVKNEQHTNNERNEPTRQEPAP